MSITFPTFPSSFRLPFIGVEFDPSRAQTGIQKKPFKALGVGQRTSAGTVAALVNTLVTSPEVASVAFGAGSNLHCMAIAWFRQNRFTPLWMVALADNGTTKAVGTITVTTSSAVAGTLYLYVAGRRFAIGVTASMAQNSLATAIGAALALDSSIPVVASVATNVVTLTAKNAGTNGNGIDVRLNYYAGEFTPAGVTVVLVQPTGGATDPDVTTVWPVIGDEQYDVMFFGWTETALLAAVKTEFDSRWGPLRQNAAYGVFGMEDTLANLVTFGSTQNSEHYSIIGMNGSPSPYFEWAAALAAIIAQEAAKDPALQFTTIEMVGVLAPPLDKRFTALESNALLYDGISTFSVGSDGTVRVGRVITTYQFNSIGAEDVSFLDANTPLTLDYLRYSFRSYWSQRYGRYKLAEDGSQFGAGQSIMTPKLARGELVNLFRLWEQDGLVEDVDQFKQDLVCEIDQNDRNRLNILLPPNLVNQLLVTAAKVQFRL